MGLELFCARGRRQTQPVHRRLVSWPKTGVLRMVCSSLSISHGACMTRQAYGHWPHFGLRRCSISTICGCLLLDLATTNTQKPSCSGSQSPRKSHFCIRRPQTPMWSLELYRFVRWRHGKEKKHANRVYCQWDIHQEARNYRHTMFWGAAPTPPQIPFVRGVVPPPTPLLQVFVPIY